MIVQIQLIRCGRVDGGRKLTILEGVWPRGASRREGREGQRVEGREESTVKH